MKNILNLFSIFITLTLTFNCSAQTLRHVQDPDADKFAGTWKWGDNTNGITLIMKKENSMKILGANNTARLDGILGFQKVIKNGLIMDDTTSLSFSNQQDKMYSFTGNTNVNLHVNKPNELRTWGEHKNKSIEMRIEYLDATHIKIIEVRNSGGIITKYPGDPPTDWSIDIPVDIVLTKQ